MSLMALGRDSPHRSRLPGSDGQGDELYIKGLGCCDLAAICRRLPPSPVAPIAAEMDVNVGGEKSFFWEPRETFSEERASLFRVGGS